MLQMANTFDSGRNLGLGPNIILRSQIEGTLPHNVHNSTITRYLTHQMININALPFDLPLNIENKLRNIYVQPLQNPQTYDKIIWEANS